MVFVYRDLLCSKVDTIVHNGAYVHWLLPYEKLKATNVSSTVDVLKLACTNRLKSVHYVSTTSVFDTKHHRHLPDKVLEDDDMKRWEGLAGGYPQTKWVSDRIAALGRAAGIPVR